MKLLIVDNFDSFTYMLVDYLRQAGAVCRVVRNNEPMAQFIDEPVDGVVLSPGPGTPRQAGRLLNVIAHYHRRVPMLGVCLGHQALGEFFGASLVSAVCPMHGKVSTIRTVTDDALLRNLPATFAVTRYHSLLLTNLPADLISTAVTETDEVMAMRHQTLPLWGVQFHPEAALTRNGLQLLTNWVHLVRKIRQPVVACVGV
ncbi:anthranilate synthase component II [Spirosoma arcticum]